MITTINLNICTRCKILSSILIPNIYKWLKHVCMYVLAVINYVQDDLKYQIIISCAVKRAGKNPANEK